MVGIIGARRKSVPSLGDLKAHLSPMGAKPPLEADFDFTTKSSRIRPASADGHLEHPKLNALRRTTSVTIVEPPRPFRKGAQRLSLTSPSSHSSTAPRPATHKARDFNPSAANVIASYRNPPTFKRRSGTLPSNSGSGPHLAPRDRTLPGARRVTIVDPVKTSDAPSPPRPHASIRHRPLAPSRVSATTTATVPGHNQPPSSFLRQALKSAMRPVSAYEPPAPRSITTQSLDSHLRPQTHHHRAPHRSLDSPDNASLRPKSIYETGPRRASEESLPTVSFASTSRPRSVEPPLVRHAKANAYDSASSFRRKSPYDSGFNSSCPTLSPISSPPTVSRDRASLPPLPRPKPIYNHSRHASESASHSTVTLRGSENPGTFRRAGTTPATVAAKPAHAAQTLEPPSSKKIRERTSFLGRPRAEDAKKARPQSTYETNRGRSSTGYVPPTQRPPAINFDPRIMSIYRPPFWCFGGEAKYNLGDSCIWGNFHEDRIYSCKHCGYLLFMPEDLETNEQPSEIRAVISTEGGEDCGPEDKSNNDSSLPCEGSSATAGYSLEEIASSDPSSRSTDTMSIHDAPPQSSTVGTNMPNNRPFVITNPDVPAGSSSPRSSRVKTVGPQSSKKHIPKTPGRYSSKTLSTNPGSSDALASQPSSGDNSQSPSKNNTPPPHYAELHSPQTPLSPSRSFLTQRSCTEEPPNLPPAPESPQGESTPVSVVSNIAEPSLRGHSPTPSSYRDSLSLDIRTLHSPKLDDNTFQGFYVVNPDENPRRSPGVGGGSPSQQFLGEQPGDFAFGAQRRKS